MASTQGPKRWRWFFGLAVLAACPFLLGPQEAKPQESKKAEKGSKPEAPPIVPGPVEQVKQEVELLEAELLVKKALVEEAKVRLEQKKIQLSRVEKLLGEGVIPEARLMELQMEVPLLEANLKVKLAEQNLGEVRLRHARQRLAQVHGGKEKAGLDHGGWWCAEHGVPEDLCSLCMSDEDVRKKFKNVGDWCKLHDRALSQCFKCDPKKYRRFEAMFEAKYGKKPEKPPESEFTK